MVPEAVRLVERFPTVELVLPLLNPGKVVRRTQNVSGHILAEIQLFRREHGTTCSQNQNSV
jgi:hypothetical protein